MIRFFVLSFVVVMALNAKSSAAPPKSPVYHLRRVPLDDSNIPPVPFTMADGSVQLIDLEPWPAGTGEWCLNDRGDLLFHYYANFVNTDGTEEQIHRYYIYFYDEDLVYPLEAFYEGTPDRDARRFAHFTSDRRLLCYPLQGRPTTGLHVFSIPVQLDDNDEPVPGEAETMREIAAGENERIYLSDVAGNNAGNVAYAIEFKNDVTGATRFEAALIRRPEDEAGDYTVQDLPLGRFSGRMRARVSLNDLNQVAGAYYVSPSDRVYRYDFDTDELKINSQLWHAQCISPLGNVGASRKQANVNLFDPMVWDADRNRTTTLGTTTSTKRKWVIGLDVANTALIQNENLGGPAYYTFEIVKGGKAYDVRTLVPKNTWLSKITSRDYARMNAMGQIYIPANDGETGQDNLVILTPQ